VSALAFDLGVDATDLFCGGGGSSEGLSQIGVGVGVAVNHWRLAVDTHQKNHPGADHDCADISQIDPRRYKRTAIAWISPDCTNHTKATGRKRDLATHTSDGKVLPSEPGERSRATMWDVVRFTEVHQYEAIIVENVIEVTAWAPFRAWVMAMESMGYVYEMVWMSSAHASAGGAAAATDRNRWYCVWTKAGAARPDLAKWTSPSGTCGSCSRHGRLVKWWKKGHDRDGGVYKRQYLWRCASCSAITTPDITAAGSVIDLSDRGRRLDERGNDTLAANTIRKIKLGLVKHAVLGIAQPFIVEMRGGGSTTRAITDPLSTITAKGNHHCLLVPPAVAVDKVNLDDCTYRYLTVAERKMASAFPAGYELLGNGSDQIRMIGNAVNPPAARVLGSAVLEALTGQVALAA
jgi:DNA (cytosine-5)-methyltransferase 1